MEINKIYNEHCLKTIERFGENYIDLTITSPPYNLGEKHHTGGNSFNAYDKYIDELPEDEYQEQQINMLRKLYMATKHGGSVFYNHKNRIKGGANIAIQLDFQNRIYD